MALVMSPTLRIALGLCVRIKGNIGGITFRRQPRTGTIVYYERRKPGSPSEKQLTHRVKFTRAYDQWASLHEFQRQRWNRAADVASTRMIGSHLFLRVWWYQDAWTVSQFLRHFNLELRLPGP